jgi:hypothetical protein
MLPCCARPGSAGDWNSKLDTREVHIVPILAIAGLPVARLSLASRVRLRSQVIVWFDLEPRLIVQHDAQQ